MINIGENVAQISIGSLVFVFNELDRRLLEK